MKQIIKYDYIILGAGIFGLHAADILGANNKRVAIVEPESYTFQRASFINQARVHNGYHYPRSYETALGAKVYFDKFERDFSFAINNQYKSIYAISNDNSLSSTDEFESFCSKLNIPLDQINPSAYFNTESVLKAYETTEHSFDASLISKYLVDKIEKRANTDFYLGNRSEQVEETPNEYNIILTNGSRISANTVINTSYASINQVLKLFNFELFNIKYEMCEVIVCDVSPNFKNTGITVMDGPFFSIMPFGLNNTHTLTSVSFTPHKTCRENLPTFGCQKLHGECSPSKLFNCNLCAFQPKSAWDQMHNLSSSYLNPKIKVNYKKSLFAIKPILISSETDDSRPTVIKEFTHKGPKLVSILSGKISTIYDIEKYILSIDKNTL